MDEIWKSIAGAARYEISSFGRVRALTRKSHGKILSGKPSVVDGYVRVRLYQDAAGPRVRMVHQLVLEAFVGPRPTDQQVRHLDGNRSNNKLTNLAWGTWHDNYADKVRHGTTNRGERSRFSKLTTEQARAVKTSTGPLSRVAQKYGISKETARKIRNGVKWTWL